MSNTLMRSGILGNAGTAVLYQIRLIGHKKNLQLT